MRKAIVSMGTGPQARLLRLARTTRPPPAGTSAAARASMPILIGAAGG